MGSGEGGGREEGTLQWGKESHLQTRETWQSFSSLSIERLNANIGSISKSDVP